MSRAFGGVKTASSFRSFRFHLRARGQVWCLVRWYRHCASSGAGEGDGLTVLVAVPPGGGGCCSSFRTGARCSRVRVAGVVRLGGGYRLPRRGDGNKSSRRGSPDLKRGLCGSLLASAPLLSPLPHCASHLAFLRRPLVAAVLPSDPYPLRRIVAAGSLRTAAAASGSDGAAGAARRGAVRGESEVIPVMG